MEGIKEERTKINEIDEKMAALFEERMQAARVIAAYKKEHGLPIYDAERERELLERNKSYLHDHEISAYYTRFFSDVTAISKQYQERLISGSRIAYCGIEGAFANIAATKIFPYGKAISYPDFRAAYEAVENGECDCCVLPVENSYAGDVGQVMDLMFSGSLYVNGIYTLRIAQHLLGVKGAKLSDIRTVVSHPQAIAQCAGYIRRKGYQTEEYSNTAAAAKEVKERNDPSAAAIASVETARLYGLEILDHDINESAGNSTRFAVFSPAENLKRNCLTEASRDQTKSHSRMWRVCMEPSKRCRKWWISLETHRNIPNWVEKYLRVFFS